MGVPSVSPNIGVFSNESALHIKWSKLWSSSFSFSISPSNEYSGLISFRIDWFELLAVQGTLKSLLQHPFESINFSAFSLLCGSTLTCIHDCWKNHSFDCTELVGKVVFLLFNMLSRFVISFLPRSKCLLISCLHGKISIDIQLAVGFMGLEPQNWPVIHFQGQRQDCSSAVG